ncbi:hypothetical protein GCM10027214_34890 [Stenotrophomonas tumulicola]
MRNPMMWALAVAMSALLPVAHADDAAKPETPRTAQQIRATAEASMVLTGTIDIATDGSVEKVALDRREKIDPGIVRFIERSADSWRFEPIVQGGINVPARAPMRVRVTGRTTDGGGMQVMLSDANFSNYDPDDTESTVGLKMTPPRYPSDAFSMNAMGTVLLQLKIERDGSVGDVVAEQVNLRTVGNERMMQNMRQSLSKAAVAAARRWTFRVPTTGDHVDEPFWTVRVPVSFDISDTLRPKDDYAAWQAYIPGPRQEEAPWRTAKPEEARGSDLMPAGGVYMVGLDKGPRLLTPLGG